MKTTSKTTNQPQHTRTKECKEKNTPSEISEKILSLKSAYSNPGVIDQAFSALASTRKSGRIANSILLAQLQKWEKFPVSQVESGIRIYLEKNYAGQGKREEYLLGISRNQNHNKTQLQAIPNNPQKKQPTMEELFSND